MSFCRRFVTYLFQYDNQVKGKNCGFAKVDVRQGRCRMEIQMSGCEDDVYVVYLLRQSEQTLIGIPVGDIPVRSGAGRTVLLFPAEEVGGSHFNLEEMLGVYLTAGKSSFVASQWEDGEVEWEAIRIYDSGAEPEPLTGDDEEDTADADKEQDTADADAERVSPDKADINVEKEASVADAGADLAVLKMQAAQTAAADISPYMTAWEMRWQRFCALHPLLFPFDEEKHIYAVKVDLRDFRSLPKQYWQLANNSFLLHGYFNYKYILLGCEDGEEKRWFLAVPGVFQNQEQLLAGIFGFGEFRTKQVTKQKTGEFGFWYRYLDL